MGLALAVGVGRFVYTPLLPVMQQEADLSPVAGAWVATANYGGYLVGAVVLSARPEWMSRGLYRACLVALVMTEALMVWWASPVGWSVFRFVAGVLSALVFVACSNTATSTANPRVIGLAFGGVGLGIVLSGTLVTVAEAHVQWQGLWLLSALLTAVLATAAWNLPVLRVQGKAATSGATRPSVAAPRAWRMLLGSYFLEGVGYIMIGTFIVAAAPQWRWDTSPASVWIVVGLFAALSPLVWSAFSSRWGAGFVLVVALLIQTAGALVPIVAEAPVMIMIAAVSFGATFMGITMLTITVGRRLSPHRGAAVLTAFYGTGQILGPLIVAPALENGYLAMFAISAVCLLSATALAAAAVRSASRAGPPTSPGG